MFKDKINYLKQTLIYAGGNLIRNLFYFLLIPLFTFKFVPAEYAVYSIITIFMSFMNLIYIMGMNESFYSYFHYKDTKEYHFTFITTTYLALFIFASVFSVLIYQFRYELSFLLLKTRKYGDIFSIVALILWFNSFYSITQSLLNIIEKSTSYIINKFVFIFVLFLFYAYGYFANKFTLVNLFRWQLYTSVITYISSSYFVLKILIRLYSKIEKAKIFSFPTIKSMIFFGLPMVPGSLSLLILALSDRYLISLLSPNGLHDAGIYAVSYKIGLTVSFLTSLYSLAYLPYAMKISKKRYAKTVYQRMFNTYLILGTMLSIAVILFAPEIFKLFINKSYHSGMKIVFFGTLSNYLIGIFYLINIAFYNIKKSKYIAVTVTFGAILNILLNIIFIPKYGMYGAGFASIFSYLIIVCLQYYIAKKRNDLGYKFIYIILSFVVILFTAFLNYVLPITYTVSIIKFVLFVYMVYYIGFRKRVFKNLLMWMKR